MNKSDWILRENFLKKYNYQGVDTKALFEIVKETVRSNNSELLDYANFVEYDFASKSFFNDKRYNDFLKSLFVFWQKNFLEKLDIKDHFDWFQNMVNNLTNFRPDFSHLRKVRLSLENYCENGIIPMPFRFQKENFCVIWANNLTKERERKFNNNIVDARLYLNIKPENIPALSQKFVQYAIKNDISLIFKIAFKKRNDAVVLYTKYDNIASLCDMIKKIKKQNPTLFEGCKVTNPMLAKINEYIGYGEEPYSYGSYNSVRVEILSDVYKKLKALYAKDKNCLTNENIQVFFDEACKTHGIDKNNFALNFDRYNYNEME